MLLLVVPFADDLMVQTREALRLPSYLGQLIERRVLFVFEVFIWSSPVSWLQARSGGVNLPGELKAASITRIDGIKSGDPEICEPVLPKSGACAGSSAANGGQDAPKAGKKAERVWAIIVSPATIQKPPAGQSSGGSRRHQTKKHSTVGHQKSTSCPCQTPRVPTAA